MVVKITMVIYNLVVIVKIWLYNMKERGTCSYTISYPFDKTHMSTHVITGCPRALENRENGSKKFPAWRIQGI